MYCTQCGHQNRNDRKFCEECGAPLKDYTKPVENTINLSEIHEKKEIVKENNKSIKVLNIVSICMFVAAVILVVASYFTSDLVKLILSSTALVLLIAYFVVRIVRFTKVKKLNNINKE